MPTAFERAYERSPRADGLDPLGRDPLDRDELDSPAPGTEANAGLAQEGRARLDDYRSEAAERLERVAQGARAAANEMEKGDDGLSRYAAGLAHDLAGFADNLRGKSVEDLVQEASLLARRNPALFITGSIAVGFGLARFARATARRDVSEDMPGQAVSANEPGFEVADEPFDPATRLAAGAPEPAGSDTFNTRLADSAATYPGADGPAVTPGIASDVIDNNRGGPQR